MSLRKTSIAVFVPNWIGDVVMATPAFRAIRNHYGPHANICAVMRPYVAGVLTQNDWFDEHLHYAPHARNHRLNSWSLVAKLRKRNIDVAILFPNSLRTAVLAWAGGATQRIGYDRGCRRLLLTKRIPWPSDYDRSAESSTLRRFLGLASAVGCPAESPSMETVVSYRDEMMADAMWEQLGLPPGERVIVLNTGSARGDAKEWPAGHFSALARRIVQTLDYTVLLNCGPHERRAAQAIAIRAAHPRVQCMEASDLSIGLTKATLRRCRLLVTTDSGPRHIAAALGTPVVSLFGPTNPSHSDNLFSNESHVYRPLPCGPCMKSVCPLGHNRCMQDLSVETVFRAVLHRLRVSETELVVA